jgi:SAM-dependent methyltransferase
VEEVVSAAPASVRTVEGPPLQTRLRCRLCGQPLARTFLDLGALPLANSFVRADRLDDPEVFYPLHVRLCDSCLLVQLPAVVAPEAIFTDYAYFSSYSDSWLEHARLYVDTVSERFEIGESSQVVEIASNDGYLLQFFQARGVPVLGVEPAANVADAAVEKGIPTVVEFFGADVGERLGREGSAADLIVGNNVLAHVPDPHDLVEGMRRLLKPDGVVTMEFPHLQRLMAERQFDTIYHEHFSYFTLLTAQRLFAEHDLLVFDVEQLPTHGGSLRIYAAHASSEREPSDRLRRVEAEEQDAGLHHLDGYLGFEAEVRSLKHDLLEFLIAARRDRKRVVAYGAAAKGNTLLNYCGIRSDLVDYVMDRNPHKQGQFLPGVRLPIHPPEQLVATKPDYVLILPWNIRDEIVEQLSYARAWGCRFVVPVPDVAVID